MVWRVLGARVSFGVLRACLENAKIMTTIERRYDTSKYGQHFGKLQSAFWKSVVQHFLKMYYILLGNVFSTFGKCGSHFEVWCHICNRSFKKYRYQDFVTFILFFTIFEIWKLTFEAFWTISLFTNLK